MKQGHDTISGSRRVALSKRAAVGLGVLAAALPAPLLASGHSASKPRVPRPETTPHRPAANPIAALLKHRLVEGQPVPVSPNRNPKFRDGKVLGTVSMALHYEVQGREEWFRLQIQPGGNSLRNLEVVPVKPVEVVPNHLDPLHPEVRATTTEAVVTISPIDGEPETWIHLSNGRREQVAVAQAAADAPAGPPSPAN